MRDKLKRRLDTSVGLTTDLIKFFLNDPQYKTRMREALQTFSNNVGREFTSEEQSAKRC
jgi:hypothetical protein